MRVQAGGDGGEAQTQGKPTRRPARYRRAQRDGHRKRSSGEEAGGESSQACYVTSSGTEVAAFRGKNNEWRSYFGLDF